MRPPKKETSTESGWKDISFKRQWRHQKDIVRREECAKSPIQSCQQEGLPNFRDVKGKPDQEKSVSSDNDVKRKMCQGKRVLKNGAVDSRDNPAVSHRSYRFLLSLKCSPISIHFETSVTRLVRALLVCLYIQIYIYIYNPCWHVTTHGSHPEVVTCRATLPNQWKKWKSKLLCKLMRRQQLLYLFVFIGLFTHIWTLLGYLLTKPELKIKATLRSAHLGVDVHPFQLHDFWRKVSFQSMDPDWLPGSSSAKNKCWHNVLHLKPFMCVFFCGWRLWMEKQRQSITRPISNVSGSLYLFKSI